jgi:signal transduction histidine kinase
VASSAELPVDGTVDVPARAEADIPVDRNAPADARSALEARIAAGRLALLDRSHTAIFFNIITAAIATLVLWDDIAPEYLLPWFVMTVAVVTARIAIWSRGRNEVGPGVTRWRLRQYLLGSGVSGTLWGVACVAGGLLGSAENVLFLAFCVGGMTAGAQSSLAPSRAAYLAYLLTATGGLAVATLIMRHPWGVAMTLLLCAYCAGMAFTATNFNRSVIDTLRLKVENELLAERLAISDAAAAALRSKWETIAHLSHELRTPLNAVMGFSDLMQQQVFGPLGTARYLEYASHIHNSGRRSLDLIESILSVSYAESGRLTLDEGPVDMAALVEKCLTAIAPVAATKRMTVTRTLGDLPVLRADGPKLYQAISNLLSNALNYTLADGHISVIGICDGAGGDCRIVIADTGIGMAPQDIPRAMEPFVRLTSALTHTVEGAGLGLPLAKRLIELHGGWLAVESAPGNGTTVTVNLPGTRRIAAEPAAAEPLARNAA